MATNRGWGPAVEDTQSEINGCYMDDVGQAFDGKIPAGSGGIPVLERDQARYGSLCQASPDEVFQRGNGAGRGRVGS